MRRPCAGSVCCQVGVCRLRASRRALYWQQEQRSSWRLRERSGARSFVSRGVRSARAPRWSARQRRDAHRLSPKTLGSGRARPRARTVSHRFALCAPTACTRTGRQPANMTGKPERCKPRPPAHVEQEDGYTDYIECVLPFRFPAAAVSGAGGGGKRWHCAPARAPLC